MKKRYILIIKDNIHHPLHRRGKNWAPEDPFKSKTDKVFNTFNLQEKLKGERFMKKRYILIIKDNIHHPL
jgi:hypothetical protein